jgi:hypothetical protein
MALRELKSAIGESIRNAENQGVLYRLKGATVKLPISE